MASTDHAAEVQQPAEDVVPVEPRSIKALTLQHLKRTFDMFAGNWGERPQMNEAAHRAKIACKIRDEYSAARKYQDPASASVRPLAPGPSGQVVTLGLGGASMAAPVANGNANSKGKSATERLIDTMASEQSAAPGTSGQLAVYKGGIQGGVLGTRSEQALVPTATGGQKPYEPSADVARRMPSKWPRPKWHAPWRNYRVISGHYGAVRSLAVDPTNAWFVSGSGDRTIKFWDLASGQLKLTLTGHIEQVTGLAVSDRMPYLFSCSLDKQVKCWDLETNKVIRNYHGHLSGVFCLALHPTINVFMTGGRDSSVRVWDIRTKVNVHVLTGHDDSVASLLSQGTDPQVISGSHDHTIKLWDLRHKKCMSTLTYHKKSIRSMALHPTEHTFASAGADNIKKYKLPRGEFLFNVLQNQKSIVNAMAVNEDDVMATGGDNGSLWFWDWRSGNSFQQETVKVQPGSLESEAGVYAMSYDQTGSRLLTAEADKTIKLWKEDEHASEHSHPINFRPPRNIRRF